LPYGLVGQHLLLGLPAVLDLNQGVSDAGLGQVSQHGLVKGAGGEVVVDHQLARADGADDAQGGHHRHDDDQRASLVCRP